MGTGFSFLCWLLPKFALQRGMNRIISDPRPVQGQSKIILASRCLQEALPGLWDSAGENCRIAKSPRMYICTLSKTMQVKKGKNLHFSNLKAFEDT